MAGVRLVVREARDVMERAAGEVGRVDVVGAAARSVLGRRVVEAERRVLLSELLDRADVAVVVRHAPEERARRVPAPLDLLARQRQQLVAGSGGVRAARLMRRDRVGGVRVSQAAGDRRALFLDPRVPLEPELMHLVRIERQRRPREDQRGVEPVAVRERRQADRLGAMREVAPAASPGSARTPGSPRRGRRPRSAAPRRGRSATGAMAGDASGASASRRSSCATARSVTRRGDVTPDATPSRAMPRPGVHVRRERAETSLVAVDPFGRVGGLHRRRPPPASAPARRNGPPRGAGRCRGRARRSPFGRSPPSRRACRAS